MIGIENIGTYIPETKINNADFTETFALEADFLADKLGVMQTSQKSADEETSDLCVKAFADLQQRVANEITEVDCLVVCTQNPDGHGIPHTSAVVHKKLALNDNCAVFDISLGCSGYVYGLAIIEGLMKSQGFSKGLLFTADPYSKIIDKTDKNTALLFGDAATATLISDQPVYESIAYKMASRGSGGRALHNDKKTLSMNGRAVFNFALTEIPLQINALLNDNALTTNDIDLFLFHQGSKFMVEKLTERIGDIQAKAPFDIQTHGNTVSSSVPLLLQKHMGDNTKNTIVLSGFGVGLSWASTVIKRVK